MYPFSKIRVEDQQPRVQFIDVKKTVVEPSELSKIEAEKVVASYERLLTRGNPKIRLVALRRLADLTMRLAETKLSVDDPEKIKTFTPAVRDASFAKAVALYQKLLNEYPNYEHIADVKYQLARAHALNSEPEKSLLLLDQIAVATVKTDSYIESQFRRGESYFVRKKYQIAEQAYTQVILKGNDTEFYDKALYKRGWSLFKQSLYPEALEDFFVLLERLYSSNEATKETSSLMQDLIADTKRVISLAFYNQDGADSVQSYFSKHGQKQYEDQIYNSLAKLYIEQERFQDAADTYLGFIKRNPLLASAPDFHSKVIDIYKEGGFPSLILPAKEEFVVNYGQKSVFWKLHDQSVRDKLKPLLKEHLVDISIFYHAAAQKSKKPADYLIAAKWYKEILDTFDQPAVDSKYRFSFAEVLASGLQFAQAAKEFEQVAYNNPPSKFSRDAGYRALVALQSIKYPKQMSDKEKLASSISSAQKFAEHFPRDKETANILARIAEQQLGMKDIAAAIATSQQLLTMQVPPTKAQTDRSQIIIANGLFDLKRYSEAEQAISDLFGNVKLSNKQKQVFHRRRAEAIYKQADSAKNVGKIADAITLYLKVGILEARSKVAVNAHYDAATLLLQTKQWDQSAELFESFRKKHPKNKLSAEIPEKLALIYEQQKNWDKAAAEFQTLASGNKDSDMAREGFWHVAELYQKAGKDTKAIAAFKHYVWTYPEPYLLAQEARYHLINLYKKADETKKVLFWRQKILQFFSKAKNKNNARTRFMAAESKFILTEPLFVQYKKIKLKLPLAKSLKRKRRAMKKALKTYESIVAYNIAEYTSASTHKIGQIYLILSKDLMSSQRPKGLGEDELEEYGYLLEDQAIPFEDKAISLFEINALRTRDNIYNDSVKASIVELSKLKPAQYNKQEKMEAIENVSF